MEHISIQIGNVLFEIYGTFNSEELYHYFPDTQCNKRTNIDKIYVIKISGKLDFYPNMNGGKKVKNFLGSEYILKETFCGKYLIHEYNDCESHAFLVTDDCFEVFYLRENIGNDLKWSIRLCRELLLYYYLEKGYVPLHASASKIDYKVFLAFGKKHSGKTTTACSFAKTGGDIISNDLVLVGENKDGIIAIGWPWKITIGNDLAKQMGLPTNTIHSKIELLPSEFCEKFHCRWNWCDRINVMIMPHINLKSDIVIDKIVSKDVLELLFSDGIEYKEIYNIFTGVKYEINYFEVIQKMSNLIPCYRVEGNIWNNIDIIRSIR